jgi:hypothetical protein
MPTATVSTSSDIDDAVERLTKLTGSDVGDAVDLVTKLNERIVETGKRVGTVYLDGYKSTVAAAISAGRKTSGLPLEVVRTLVEAQTDVASEITKTYTAMVREVLAA